MKQGEFYKGKVWAEEKSRFYTTLTQYKEKNKKILEIGCGAGGGTLYLKSLLEPKEIIGVDISKTAVEKTQKKGIVAHTINVSEERLPFKDEVFDLVVSFEVIEHVFDTGSFIEEIKRVLKPGGTLFISTPNLAWWANKLLLTFGYQPANTEVDLEHATIGKPKMFPQGTPAGHIHVFTKKSMKEFLKIHDIYVHKTIAISYEHIYTSSFAKNSILRIFYACDKILSPFFGEAFTVYIGKKRT